MHSPTKWSMYLFLKGFCNRRLTEG
jgi:hypothetical protein